MPEQQPARVDSSGYPPMTTLRGAVPGWLHGDPLTSVFTPDAARAALRAESETSVLDVTGMRRLWVRELAVFMALGIVVLMIVGSVQHFRDGETPGWWLPLVLVALAANIGLTFLDSVCRAIPGRRDLPRPGLARLRWYRRLRQEAVMVPEPAAWPPGSEAFAVLSSAAGVDSVAPAWLSERIGMSPEVGRQWVAVLAQQGWLFGGGRPLGLARLPEKHVMVTSAGRTRLDRERARLQALAAG